SLSAVPAGSSCPTAPPPFVQRPNACRYGVIVTVVSLAKRSPQYQAVSCPCSCVRFVEPCSFAHNREKTRTLSYIFISVSCGWRLFPRGHEVDALACLREGPCCVIHLRNGQHW
ncbi:unnamed protein product, partial [Ectocarpus sp. 13 AM-2016]